MELRQQVLQIQRPNRPTWGQFNLWVASRKVRCCQIPVVQEAIAHDSYNNFNRFNKTQVLDQLQQPSLHLCKIKWLCSQIWDAIFSQERSRTTHLFLVLQEHHLAVYNIRPVFLRSWHRQHIFHRLRYICCNSRTSRQEHKLLPTPPTQTQV